MTKATDQCEEGILFLMELRSLSVMLQSSLNEDIRDAGYSLEDILIKYHIIEGRE